MGRSSGVSCMGRQEQAWGRRSAAVPNLPPFIDRPTDQTLSFLSHTLTYLARRELPVLDPRAAVAAQRLRRGARGQARREQEAQQQAAAAPQETRHGWVGRGKEGRTKGFAGLFGLRKVWVAGVLS